MAAGPIQLVTVQGSAITAFLPDLARLRISVFQAWPYLYQGSEAYERDYLRIYAESDAAAIVIALDQEQVVGAATCLPLGATDVAIQAPIRARGWNMQHFFYFGESVLLPAYHGQGTGVAFFDAREAHARTIPNVDFACFCSVCRPADHPRRPPGAAGLDAFWRRRGYVPVPDLACALSWLDVGAVTETVKPLDFWIRSLSGASLPTASMPIASTP